MIVTLLEAKEWLNIDYEEDDSLINGLILAAETYLKNATGKQFDGTNELAKLFVRVLITDWYENREYEVNSKSNGATRTRFTISSILSQLQYGDSL